MATPLTAPEQIENPQQTMPQQTLATVVTGSGGPIPVSEGASTNAASQESFITANTANDVVIINPGTPVATVDVTGAPVTEATIVPVKPVPLSKPVGDWRARLQLAPQADYLYNAPAPGILAPLAETQGIIFPYTPSVETVFHAAYAETQLTHANWKGYHYTGSNPGEITVTAVFTAQDNKEAAYLLAVIHFLRSATKMFYGQDFERGAPPPVLFFSAFGQHQYNRTPVVIREFNYSCPADVHYISTSLRSVSAGASGSGAAASSTSLLGSVKDIVGSVNKVINRIQTLGGNIGKGGVKTPLQNSSITALAAAETSYVPSKIDVTITLLPMPSRKQMSSEFSFKEYANGTLITKGIL